MHLTTSSQGPVSPAWSAATWPILLVIGALLLVFSLDRATGSTPVQHLYYLPIILAAVRFRIRGGIIAALSAIALYHTANPHLLGFHYEESDLIQIVLFLAVGMITAKLALDANRMRQLAMTDDLTGLHNLRSFEGRLATIVHGARETRAPLAVLVLDVDRLKLLNDQYGHLAGAEAVRTVGHVLGQHLPAGAVACRYGGDEFAIAIPRCTSFLANRVADILCSAVRETAPVLAGRAFPAGTLSISVGASCGPLDWSLPDIETGEALFRLADAALYRAKVSGRNRVCV